MRSDFRLAYVCADRGIPPDGVKGASVHYREMGQALGDAGIAVQGITRRKPKGRFDLFPHTTVPKTERSDGGERKDPLSQELDELTDQQGLIETLDICGPFDAVYERYSLFGLGGLSFARRQGVPFVLEVNAPLWEEAKRFRSLKAEYLAHAVAMELFVNADLVLTVSDRLRSRLVGEGVAPDRISVFPNGVHQRFFEDVPNASKPTALAQKRVLLFVGSLKPWHGVEFLLDAFVKISVPDTALWIVGDGPLRGRVEGAARRFPERIAYTGAVEHELIPFVLNAADAVVAPYVASSPDYFCPLKVVEALAAGIPLLASDVPAVRDLGLASTHVSWFAPGSVEDFGRALARVFGNLERARALSRINRSVAQVRFSWAHRVEELMDMLGALTPRRTRLEQAVGQ